MQSNDATAGANSFSTTRSRCSALCRAFGYPSDSARRGTAANVKSGTRGKQGRKKKDWLPGHSDYWQKLSLSSNYYEEISFDLTFTLSLNLLTTHRYLFYPLTCCDAAAISHPDTLSEILALCICYVLIDSPGRKLNQRTPAVNWHCFSITSFALPTE